MPEWIQVKQSGGDDAFAAVNTDQIVRTLMGFVG